MLGGVIGQLGGNLCRKKFCILKKWDVRRRRRLDGGMLDGDYHIFV